MQVKELMALTSFQGSKCIAGERGLDRAVEDISVMEVPDIEDYVSQDAFLVTTLYPLYANEEKMRSLIPKLNAVGLSGLAIKVNRYISEVPEYFVEQANTLDFPLLVLPNHSNLSTLINEFLKENNYQKSLELEYRNNIHNSLMECMLQGEEYTGLAETLGKLLYRNAVLYNKDMDKLGEYVLEDQAFYEDSQIVGAACRLFQYEQYDDYYKIPLKHGCAVLYRVQYGYEKIGYIVLFSSEDFGLSALEKIAVEQFAIVFRIIIQRQKAITELENRYIEGFTCDLLFGKITSDYNAASRASALGWKMTFPMSLLLIDMIDLPDRIKDKVVLIRSIRSRIHTEAMGLSEKWNCFFAGNDRYIVGFLDNGGYNQYQKIGQLIQDEFDQLGIRFYFMAVSRPAQSVQGITKCYEEAEKTLDIARLMDRREVLHFRDIGVYRIIHTAGSKGELKEFCLDTIGPLIDYDQKNNASLLQTLSTILEQSGNLKEASKKLFIHYNTVRYRFRLIEDILGKKLDTISDYHDLNLALKIYYSLHLNNKNQNIR